MRNNYSALHRAFLIAVLAVMLSVGCGSSINVTRYRSPKAERATVQRVAVMPLLVTSAAET
jgi:hypothetical protein